jgi:hypothetical protein
MASTIRREVDILDQKIKEDIQTLKHEYVNLPREYWTVSANISEDARFEARRGPGKNADGTVSKWT